MKPTFCFRSMLTLCILTMMPAYVLAQRADNLPYAWRLDSIVYALTPDAYGSFKNPIVNISYTYGENSITKTSLLRAIYHNYSQVVASTKQVYTLSVDSGKYIEDTYAEASSAFPAKSRLCMVDSVRSVYDDAGHLLRTIHNYDYITLRMNPVYDEQSGNMTGMEWTPYSRIIRQEDEQYAIECDYTYDPSTRQWKAGQDSIRSTYYNHILVMKEHIYNRTYHPNGTLASFDVDVYAYESGITTYTVNRRENRNENNMPTSIITTHYVSGDSFKKVENIVYIYDDTHRLVSTHRSERTVDIVSARTLQQNEYVYNNDQWELQRHHYFQYDNRHNLVLDVDSFINSKGMWRYERKEYANGEETYSRSDCDDYAYGGWMTFSEKIHCDEYRQDMMVSIQGNSVNGGAYHYDTIRDTQRYYTNHFDEMRKREKLNTRDYTWKLLNYNRTETTFDSEGKPVSAIEYVSSDTDGNSWQEKYLYTFTYDAQLNLYLRTMTAEMVDNGDGTRSWQQLTKKILGIYYSIEHGEMGWENEFYYAYSEDKANHKEYIYEYEYVELTATWELTYRIEITYFPEPDCTQKASVYQWRTDKSSVVFLEKENEVWQYYTDTFDIFDSNGVFTEQHAYYWEDNTLRCDTLIREQPSADDEIVIAIPPLLSWDENGNITDYTLGEESYHLTYGSALSDEPVLSPAAFGIADEDMFLYTHWLNPNEIKARLLTAHHQSDDRTSVLSSTVHYMARFYYTSLTEKTDTMKTEIEQGTDVQPSDSSATFTWPQVSGGATYTLIIWADAERTIKICTLHLAADGTLIEIDFSRAPRRGMPTDYQPAMLSTVIPDLLPQTRYWYTLQAYDDAGLLIDSTLGTFSTLGTTDLINPNITADQPIKVLQNGQLIILHPQGTYNAQGQSIK